MPYDPSKALEFDGLQALFDKKHFVEYQENLSRYWIPIIAAFSGMIMEDAYYQISENLQPN